MIGINQLQFDRRDAHGISSPVLTDITLDIREGEMVSLIGPSGCGKTTLLRLVAGLEVAQPPGAVLVDGVDPIKACELGLVGFVFQQPVLFPWKTVWDNVAFPMHVGGGKVDSCRVDGLLELVGLAGSGDLRPNQLSGGMQSRVAIARAFSTKPRVLLLDEPFADLDEINRERMNLELQRVFLETRATMLFVTHDLEEAVFLADRVVVLSSRPGHVAETIEVQIPRPRSVEVFDSKEFENCLASARRALRRATGLS